MDTTAHSNRSSLMHCGLALVCVLLAGCQQLAQQPIESGADPELAELAAKLSMEGEPNSLAMALANKTEALAPVKSVAKAEPAVPAPAKIEASSPAKKAEPAITAPARIEATSAVKIEPAITTPVKKTEPAAPVKKVEVTAPAQKVEMPAPVKKIEAPATAQKPGSAGSAAMTAEGAAVKAEGSTEGSAESVGPEIIPESRPETTTQPEGKTEPEKLTKADTVVFGGKEVVISELLPMKNLNMKGELQIPAVVFDTKPLAAANPTAEVLPAAPAASKASEDADSAEEEGGRSVFRGLLGWGSSAVGYAGRHYVALGSVALVAPAVFIFARRKRFFFRAFRKMNLDD
ncbi:MAG: hypothetical protein IH624_06370 [Phycisphaerae bacterium]|nr:hypothetical protein [Phycisphaerae bacterium]